MWRESIQTFIKLLCFMGLLLLINFPLALAITHDNHLNKLIYPLTLSLLPVLYGLKALNRTSFFTAVCISTLIGYFVLLLSWFLTGFHWFYQIVLHTHSVGSYNCGLVLPALPNLYLTKKRMKSHKGLVFSFIAQSLIFLFVAAYLILNLTESATTHPWYLRFSALFIGLCIGSLVWFVVQKLVAKRIHLYEKISAYLKVMAKPVVAFFIGYLVIMLCFAGLYSLAYIHDHQVFNHLKNDSLTDMLYYSFSIITGLGFSIIEPEKPITLFLTGLENFLGLVWVTVIFAATIAYLQKPFEALSLRFKNDEHS